MSRRIQAALVKEGFDPGPIDGVRGEKTKAALRQWSLWADALPRGIDISHYQTKIDWKALAPQLGFIACRASVSLFKDKLFEQYWRGAKEVGLLRSAYHFFNPSRDPQKQAELIWSRIEKDPGELPITLDVESMGSKGEEVERGWLIASVTACTDRLLSLSGRGPLLYTYSAFAIQNKLGSYFGSLPLWIADYREGPPTIEGTGWSQYLIHQYAGDTGRISGVQGPCDQNRFRGSLEDLKKLARV